ncbi:hypothetical protein NE261_05225 [Enterococcus italicus]|uniref:hypothetical protein n=1 Tax=Enterococcus italicus TaxID=246144 RepID=UPI0020739466|nr:hypothetical protein [Enterococcus italicus]MCM6931210.1 hypothetical protein [Enterococcus italicus]
MENYDQQLNKLKSGEIKKIYVERDNFMLFRDSWLKREDRKYFVGEATHNGNINYRYDKTVV